MTVDQFNSLYALHFTLGLFQILALGWIAGHQR